MLVMARLHLKLQPLFCTLKILCLLELSSALVLRRVSYEALEGHQARLGHGAVVINDPASVLTAEDAGAAHDAFCRTQCGHCGDGLSSALVIQRITQEVLGGFELGGRIMAHGGG